MARRVVHHLSSPPLASLSLSWYPCLCLFWESSLLAVPVPWHMRHVSTWGPSSASTLSLTLLPQKSTWWTLSLFQSLYLTFAMSSTLSTLFNTEICPFSYNRTLQITLNLHSLGSFLSPWHLLPSNILCNLHLLCLLSIPPPTHTQESLSILFTNISQMLGIVPRIW